MRKLMWRFVALSMTVLVVGGCEGWIGPKRTGEVTLSSETFGESYYIFGYAYENGELYRWPFQGEPVPDIINEGYLILVEGEVSSLPGFNTPAQMNGFALVGEFSSSDEAREFYEGYDEVTNDLQFETVSDTVELNQVWVQKTSLDNYVKLLITSINTFQGEFGKMNNEVTFEYTYQPNGSARFPD